MKNSAGKIRGKQVLDKTSRIVRGRWGAYRFCTKHEELLREDKGASRFFTKHQEFHAEDGGQAGSLQNIKGSLAKMGGTQVLYKTLRIPRGTCGASRSCTTH